MIKCFPDIYIKPQATVHLYEAQRLITGRQYRIQCKKGSVVVTTSPEDKHDDGFLIILDDYLNMSGDVWVTNTTYGTAIISISETGESSIPNQVEDINITPQSTLNMDSNSTLQFTSDAPGAIYAVTKGVGSITSTGLYTAPSKGYEGTTTIEAHLDNRWGKATIGPIISNVKITGNHYEAPLRAGGFVDYDDLFTVTGASRESFTYQVVPTEAGIFDISGLNISSLFTDNTIMVEATYSEDMTVNGVALMSNVNPVLSGLRMEIRLGDESSYNSNTQTWNMEKGFQYGVVVYPVPDGSLAPDIMLSTDEASIVSEQPTPGVFLITANSEFTGKGLNFQSNGVELQITINSAVKPTIVGKTVNGKVGGDKVFFTEMFTSNTASSSFAYTITPNTDVSINTTTGVLTLGDSASGTYTVVATHRTQPDVTATATATIANVVPKASIVSKGPIDTAFVGGGLIAITVMFNFINSAMEDYNITVSPTSNGSYRNGGIYLTDNASGSTVITAVHKTQGNIVGSCTLSNVSPKAIINAKTQPGRVGGDTILFADLFSSNYTADSFNYVLNPTEAGTVDASGNLVLAPDPGDELITLKATHKAQHTVTATCNIVATPELVGIVLQGVTNGVAVGDINLPSVTDSLTITDPNSPAVFRIDTVFQGALLGVATHSLAGSEISKIESVVINGDLLTITLNEPLFSDDTSITITAGDVTRTYLLYSGE